MRIQPFFADTFPRSRRPEYPRQRGESRATAVIVGGGLTGCACASAFASAGVNVMLLEADRLGAAATAGAPGLLRQDYDASFQGTASLHGLRVARHVWQGIRRASLEFAAAVRRLGIRCDLAPQDLLLVARHGAEGARLLQREYAARRAAGLDVTWMNARAVAAEAGTDAAGGMRVHGDAFDPYRVCLGLAAAAVGRGAAIHEHSPVRRIRVRRKAVEIKTDGGLVTADTIVVATGSLIDDLRALRRHFAPRQRYALVTEPLPAAVRREVGRRRIALQDAATPPRLLRWLKDDRVLCLGGDHAPLGGRAADKAVVPGAMELMYELTTIYPAISGVQPAWAWNEAHYGSPDDLPVIGAHRNFPRHLFALGLGSHGAGASWLAARVLVRAVTGSAAKGDDLFGFARVL